MARRGAKSNDSRVLAPASAPVPLDLIRKIFAEPAGSPLAAPSASESLPASLADPRFQELVEIVNLAVQVHGSAAQEWFVRPEPELGFVLPATLMRDPANGRKLVKQSLMNHLRGVYALAQDGRVLPKSLPSTAPAGPALPHARGARLPEPKKKTRR